MMRYAMYVSGGALCWGVLLALCLHTGGATDSTDDSTAIEAKSEDSNSQIEPSMYKRDWNRNLKMWGKRGWQSLHGGWGLKRDAAPWEDHNYTPSETEKRAWQNLQGAWGKRLAPEDERAIRELAELLEEDDQEQPFIGVDYVSENDLLPNSYEKRAWKQFGGGWGKRASDSWKHFRGSWGKREPAWNNLKGIWGKRSFPDSIIQ